MATEFIYWGITSMLGAQENKLNEISQEWDLNTIDLVKNIGSAIYSLLSNPEYIFPKSIQNGTFRR